MNHFSTQAGFCHVARPDGSSFISAWPIKSWVLPRDSEAWTNVVSEIRQTEADFSRGKEKETVTGGFSGGLVGVLNYDAGSMTVPGFRARQRSDALPDVGWVGCYEWALNLPAHTEEPATLLIDRQCSAKTLKLLQPILEGQLPANRAEPDFKLNAPFGPQQSPATYSNAIKRILEYIHAGDCYQVNYAQQFTAAFEGQPFAAYRTLLEAIPVPHAAYIDTGRYQVLSISPERYLKIRDGQVESKPIKGTRPRGESAQEDTRHRDELAASKKDRAENLMIVDLIRNDLSRFCTPHSVQVPKLFEIESFRNVHQLVSTVTGELKPGTLAFDALLSAFPGGSITGAPKRRAMEIIDELEPSARGPYCGSVFSIGNDGTLDSNIAIRTLLAEPNGRISCWGGGGIVADSDPSDEFAESVTKVQRLMQTLENL
ncbi:aminodeoxychorismate synthase component I [Marinobacter sp. NFXS9]|uniref:aminodeoxychorismate synthase component I n=1 Tax=Marinobacter sp. NFXS9 TaxID=2818433 RepID=UPI0032DE34CA